MTLSREILQAMLALGLPALVAALGTHSRRLGWLAILGALVGVGWGLAWKILDTSWLAGSLLGDPPWLAVAAVAAWAVHAESGWVQTGRWWQVVGLSALLGGRFGALAAAAAEPDKDRRGRLVLAAVGASLLGPLGHPAGMLLGGSALGGDGGLSIGLLGVALALVGWAGGGVGASLVAPRAAHAPPGRLRRLIGAGLLSVGLAGCVWLMMGSGVLEYAAMNMEKIPDWNRSLGPFLLLASGLGGGVLLDSTLGGLYGHALFASATTLHGAIYPQAVMVGAVVGGALPLLWLTGSLSWRSLGRWMLQVALVVGWCWLARP